MPNLALMGEARVSTEAPKIQQEVLLSQRDHATPDWT